MERKPKILTNWAEEASQLILINSDRALVEAELLAHMEDIYEGYLSSGCDEKTAAERTVQQMGDAQTVAEQMRMVYRPFWGVLAYVTDFLVAFAGLFLVICLAFTLWDVICSGDGYHPDDAFAYITQAEKLNDYHPDATVKSGGYTIKMERVVFAQHDEQIVGHFVLKISYWNPWLQTPLFCQNLSATDNCGNDYPSGSIYNPNNRDGEVAGNRVYNGYNVGYYEMWVSNVDPNATTITVGFDDYGVKWGFPLDIYEEVTR